MITQDRNAPRYRHNRPDRRAGQFASRAEVAREVLTRDGNLIARSDPRYGASQSALKAAADASAFYGVPTVARRKPSAAQRRAAKTTQLLWGGRNGG